MVDFLFNFTTKLFDTNPPKLWPINTIGWCHLYLHKTYSFVILSFEEISNWLLHFILVKSIFMCDWNISSNAHFWNCSKELLHIPALQLSSWHFQILEKPSFLTPISKNITYFSNKDDSIHPAPYITVISSVFRKCWNTIYSWPTYYHW
jgi:hypothetical protein